MAEKPGKLIWLRIIGYMLIPIFLAPVFFYLTFLLKPHCSLGQGAYGCTPQCEAISYFPDGRPSDYKETPCFHEAPTMLQRFLFEKPAILYLALLVVVTGLFVWLTKINRLGVFAKVAFAPIYFIKENRHNKNFIVRLLILIFLIVPLTIEWTIGYIITIGTLLNKINLF